MLAMVAALGLVLYAVAGSSGFRGTLGDWLRLGGVPPTCRASQLRPGPLRPVTAGLGFTLVTNTSRSACSLPTGDPQISLSSEGRKQPVRQTHGIFSLGNEPAVHTLQPGASAQIDFQWENGCGRPKALRLQAETLRIRLGNAFVVSGDFARPNCYAPGSPSIIATGPPHAWTAKQ
jgi:hypothetical protein